MLFRSVPAAIELARTNATAHGVAARIDFRVGSLWAPLRADERGTFDVLVSNPPYVADYEWDEMAPNVREHEPRTALAGGAQGMDVLAPLIAGAHEWLRPGGRLVVQEYVHWDTFGLHPHGRAITRFGQAVQRSFRAAGGDPDVNRRLPSLLAARGFQIEALTPVPVLGGEGSMAAQWLQRFVAVYAAQLMAQGLWSADDQIGRAHV